MTPRVWEEMKNSYKDVTLDAIWLKIERMNKTLSDYTRLRREYVLLT